MIDDAMRLHIATRLAQIETEEGVRILFAAESGSRAWGFASPDSDYDVRFIYAHVPDWYLQLTPGRDVIERPLDPLLIDLAGWDVRKALQLLLKSNPVLYEWLCSPIVYIDDGAFRPRVMPLFEQHASPKTLAHHYANIARTSWRTRIDGREAVSLKKYFYVVRPLLSLQWVAEKHTPPPMSLPELLAASPMSADVRAAVQALVAAKRETPEFGDGPRQPVIDAWITDRLDRLSPERLTYAEAVPGETVAAADALFRLTIAERSLAA